MALFDPYGNSAGGTLSAFAGVAVLLCGAAAYAAEESIRSIFKAKQSRALKKALG